MDLLKIVSLILLWSGTCFSQTPPKVTFQVLGPNYIDAQDSKIEVPNMPRIKSQDSLGICYACSAATIAQKFYCDAKKIENCSAVPPEKDISMLSMVGWSKLTDPTTDQASKMSMANHKNLDLQNGGSAQMALRYSQESYTFATESCYPFDQLANRYGRENEKLFSKNLNRIKDIYTKNKKSETEASQAECIECLNAAANEINSTLLTTVDPKLLPELFQEKTFEQFLYKAFFRDCKTKSLFTFPQGVGTFPNEEESGDMKGVISKIQQILTRKQPLLIEGICIQRNENNECETSHSVVISGYKRSCDKSGKCRDLLKIQNCWGEDWQKSANDGWLDAEAILLNAKTESDPKNSGKMSIAKGTLSWLVY